MFRTGSVLDSPHFRRWLLVAISISGTLVVHGLTREPRPSTVDPASLDSAMPDPRGLAVPSPSEHAAMARPGALGGIDFQLPTPSPAGPDSSAPSTLSERIEGSATARAKRGLVELSARLDRSAVLQGSDGLSYLELELRAGVPEGESARVPTDLVVVLDHSGSMAGEKIEDAKSALLHLVDQLHDGDRFTLVGFESRARTLVAPSFVTAPKRRHWKRQIGQIFARGGTHMRGGLEVALAHLDTLEAPLPAATLPAATLPAVTVHPAAILSAAGPSPSSHRSQRVLLLSDGLPDSASGLDALSRRIADRGVALSTLGVGHDFDEVLMGRLADLGTGRYYYLGQTDVLAQVFLGELSAGRSTIARDLEIAVSRSEGLELVAAAGYPIVQGADAARFRAGHLGVGQTRRLWLTFEADTDHTCAPRAIGPIEMRFVVEGESQLLSVGGGAGENATLRLACTSNRDEFLAGVDAEIWGRATIGEAYGALQRRVAEWVREGRKVEAIDAIESYRSQTRELNSVLHDAKVEANLRDLDALDASVESAFQGEDQAYRQNVTSKEVHALSQALRRMEEPSEGGR